MRNLAYILALSCAPVVLAACGETDKAGSDGAIAEAYASAEDEDGTTMSFSDGEGGEMTMRTGNGLDADLPDGFTLPSGANVTASAVMSEGEGAGQMVSFASDMDPASLLARLRSQAENAGYEIETELTTEGMRVIGGKNAKDGYFQAQVMAGGTDASTATLTFSQGM